MPFPKGNPGGAYSIGVPRPGAKESRKANKSLAMAIRDGVKPETVRDWLISIWQTGKDPTTGSVVDMRHRIACLQLLLDRGYGQSAQMLVVEGSVKHEVALSSPAEERPRLTLAEIDERRAALRKVLGPGPVIDVSSAE